MDSVVQGTDTFKVFFDRFGNVSIQDVSHVVSTLTNVANGKVVHVDSAGRDAFSARRGGQPGRHHHLHRYPHRDALAGLHLHSNTLVKDVGFLSIVTTFDSQGNFLSQQVIPHGPHPFAGD